MKVKFINVGRENKNRVSDELKEVTYETLAQEIYKNSALVSSNVSFSETGQIYAGFHNVGTFEILN